MFLTLHEEFVQVPIKIKFFTLNEVRLVIELERKRIEICR